MMQKHSKKYLLPRIAACAAGLFVLLALPGCGSDEEPLTPSALSSQPTPTPGPSSLPSVPEETPAAEGSTVKAMYLPLGRNGLPEDGYLLVDQKDDSLFTLGSSPEDLPDDRALLDIHGNPMDWDDLKKGDLVEIEFRPDSVTLEIYPSIRQGAVRVRVTKEGDPQDAARYESLISQFYQPQPQTPPSLQFDYAESQTESGSVRGGSISPSRLEWHYHDAEGDPQTVTGDEPPILQRDGLEKLELTASVPLSLYFGEEPQEWTVVRWKAELLGSEDPPEGEPVELTAREAERGGWIIEDAEPGWVYQVTLSWHDGEHTGSWAEYAFTT